MLLRILQISQFKHIHFVKDFKLFVYIERTVWAKITYFGWVNKIYQDRLTRVS